MGARVTFVGSSDSAEVPRLRYIVTYWPILHSIWDGLASTLALALFMSTQSATTLESSTSLAPLQDSCPGGLPSCLMFICSHLFVTKSERRLLPQKAAPPPSSLESKRET